MTRLVEINAESVQGIQRDVRNTRDGLEGGVGPLRRRAGELGVATGAFDELLDIAHRLDTAVLPVVAVHLQRAQDLAAARYTGSLGTTLPVVDAPWTMAANSTTSARFTLAQAQNGSTVVSWAQGSAAEQEQERQTTSTARSLTHWLGEKVAGVYDAVEEGAEHLAATAMNAWRSVTAVASTLGDAALGSAQDVAEIAGDLRDGVTEAGRWARDAARGSWDAAQRGAAKVQQQARAAAWKGVVDAVIGASHAIEAADNEVTEVRRWWQDTTADAGAWIDEHGAGVREWIGEHVAAFRWAAKALRITGWVVVVVGVVLTVVLAVEGALGGGIVGGVFGAGVGAAPGGVAGAVAGATTGLKVVGLGFSLVAAGDFVDSLADWGEGDIDGQQLVESATWNLAMAAGSFVGIGVVGKIVEKVAEHLPPSAVKRIDDLLGDRFAGLGFGRPRRQPPLDEAARRAPLLSGAPEGPGWQRRPDKVEEPLAAPYGQPQPRIPGDMNPGAQPPAHLDPSQRNLPGAAEALQNPWGVDPVTGKTLTEQEFTERFIGDSGWPRYPPNDGAGVGTKIDFTDPADFTAIYGNHVDRIGGRGGEYLAVPPGVSFESRALPPDTLGKELHEYVFSGTMPEGWTIEVSHVAPAFGRAGGGTQVRVLDDEGAAVPVRKLIDEEVLRR